MRRVLTFIKNALAALSSQQIFLLTMLSKDFTMDVVDPTPMGIFLIQWTLMFRWCVLTKVIYTLCISKFKIILSTSTGVTSVRSHDGMMYNKKAVISPNIRVNCCSRSRLRFDGSHWRLNYFSNIYQSMQYDIKYFLNSHLWNPLPLAPRVREYSNGD